jgi:hypothetical protein
MSAEGRQELFPGNFPKSAAKEVPFDDVVTMLRHHHSEPRESFRSLNEDVQRSDPASTPRAKKLPDLVAFPDPGDPREALGGLRPPLARIHGNRPYLLPT